MPSLRIYDTKGNEYSPSGGTGRTNEKIKELFYSGVRFAFESGRETKVTAFFRARETRDARSEQFYAEYTTRGTSTPINDFNDALRQRVESEWGYTIDDSSEEMSVFRALIQNDTSSPGSDQERRILRELIGSRSLPTVGVRDARSAVGLMLEMNEEYSRAAITDSADTDSLSDFDLAVVTNGQTGIEPLGATKEQWEQTEQSLRNQFIDEEISRIDDAVQSLSRDYGLSNSEIRSRVSSRVPALKQRSDGSSSVGTKSASKSRKQKLLSPEVGLYVAVVAVALLLIGGAGFGAGMLGYGPLASDDTIDGTVLESEDGDGVEGVTVTLVQEDEDGESPIDSEEHSSIENVTDEDGHFSFTGVNDGEFTLRIESDDRYEPKEDVSPGDTVEFVPDIVEASVFGTVVDEGDGSLIDDATVELLDADDDVIDEGTGGEFEFAVEDPDAVYTVRASAEGYEEVREDDALANEDTTIELAENQVALSGTVSDSTDGESIEEAVITATNEAGESESSESDGDGSYELALPRGEYDIEISADDYESMTETVTLDNDEATEDFELDPWASWSGTVREEGEPESELNGAEITLLVDGEETHEALSDGDGSFSFEELSPTAEYTVNVERSRNEDEEFTISFEPGDQSDRDIELES